MVTKTIGFIGGGRVTKIMLNGWKRANKLPAHIIVTDINPELLETLKKDIPTIKTVIDNHAAPAACDVVFIGLHPPVIGEILQK